MFVAMAQDERVQFLNDKQVPRRPVVLYWMQSSVRSRFNHALEYALHLAKHRGHHLQVIFALSPGYPGAALRHYWFLLQGLKDVAVGLQDRDIPFEVWLGDAPEVAIAASRHAGTVVTDRGYTRVLRDWRRKVAAQADCPVVQVESNVVVPLEAASTKEEWAAATYRPKVHRRIDEFLQPVQQQPYTPPADAARPVMEPPSPLRRLDLSTLSSPDDLTGMFTIDAAVAPVQEFIGGQTAAQEQLHGFLHERLVHFDERRNIPDQDWTSHLSFYLHFGHISPVEIVLAARKYMDEELDGRHREDLDSFVEELVVRRELAMNYTQFNEDYDRWEGLPEWARTTLNEHNGDERPMLYTARQLENAETEDPYWNAAQREMVRRGTMHGYMRMYWGKKILEWMQDPAEAHATAIHLNDRYELDGRDPNGYTGVAWCFGKHDRGWAERPVFGKVRYMNANGLRRKFKEIDLYVHRWRE